ncbi:phage Gp37/Gp68 family protein [uncultured Bacteroides sp.]|uniref:phage Gp37/Gp68 family protein n=1 Tax=uncultured Bacteroides sp. TaxID=162156 RepID=UPI0026234D5A|nr:phage Gp37/Gp68 family protein [uncultured Bacteroides sp.]
MATTSIEWTDKTWNPVTGCTKISMGCEHCYAAVMARRLKGMNKPKYANGFNVATHSDVLREPMLWKNPCVIFVCSMSDLFHKDVPFDFIDKVMQVIKETPRHNYQILTKRAERLAEYFASRQIPKNVWVGVTVELQATKFRLDCLRDLKAHVKFISCEPLLEDLGELDLTGIDWIIVGGESGTQARPMKEEWVLNIKKQADAKHIPFFFKQWGTWGVDGVRRNKKENGKLLRGEVVQCMPVVKNS